VKAMSLCELTRDHRGPHSQAIVASDLSEQENRMSITIFCGLSPSVIAVRTRHRHLQLQHKFRSAAAHQPQFITPSSVYISATHTHYPAIRLTGYMELRGFCYTLAGPNHG